MLFLASSKQDWRGFFLRKLARGTGYETVFFSASPVGGGVDIYGLLTKREVKMAGYWPGFCFACLWTETKLRSINTQKRMRPMCSHLKRASLVNKGFVIWDKTPKHYLCTGGTKPVSRAGNIAPSCLFG